MNDRNGACGMKRSELGDCLNKTMCGCVNGVYGMNTTTPMKKNEKNETGKNREKPIVII